MSFIAPYMLWGTLAASIPIALHFFYRSRYRTLPWAAMKFLLTSIEQTSRRLKFQELLLLLARIMLLVLLAMALARPSTTAGKGAGRGDAVDAVLVIDTSFSMDGKEGPASRLDQAKKAALAVLDQLPVHSTVQIVTCSDRAAWLGPRSPANLDHAKQIVQEIQVSHQATDFQPGFNEAAGRLASGHSPNKELYLFSDMHRLGWEQQGNSIKESLQKISQQATVYLVRCGSREPKNVALVDIVPQSGIPHTGERAGFAVLVRNTGKDPVRNLQVTLTVDGSPKIKETQPLGEVAPGSTRAVPVTVKLDKVGLRILTASVQSDDLEADNKIDRAIYVRDQVRILVIDGAPDDREPDKSASFYLMHVLSPVREGERSKYHVQPRMVPAGQAGAALLANQDICMLANVALPSKGGRRSETLPPDFTRQLAAFVKQGHGLVIYGGDNVVHDKEAIDAYNAILHERYELLPLRLTAPIEVPAERPFHLDRSTFAATFFEKFREDEHYRGVSKVEVTRALGVEELPKEAKEAKPPADGKPAAKAAEPGNVLLRYSNGRPAVVSRRAGSGEVVLVTTSADLRWSDWMLRFNVPFLDMTISHLLDTQTQNHNARSGDPIRWQAGEGDAGRAFALVHPDGRRVRLAPPASEQGRPVVTTADTPRAGVYRLLPADEPADKPGAGVPFAVIPDLRESENLEALTASDLDRRLGIPLVHLSAGDDPAVFSGAERLKREWTMWLLLAVLGVAFIETFLAWLCGKAW